MWFYISSRDWENYGSSKTESFAALARVPQTTTCIAWLHLLFLGTSNPGHLPQVSVWLPRPVDTHNCKKRKLIWKPTKKNYWKKREWHHSGAKTTLHTHHFFLHVWSWVCSLEVLKHVCTCVTSTYPLPKLTPLPKLYVCARWRLRDAELYWVRM